MRNIIAHITAITEEIMKKINNETGVILSSKRRLFLSAQQNTVENAVAKMSPNTYRIKYNVFFIPTSVQKVCTNLLF